MLNIRHSVFETNSSSSHSVTVHSDLEGLYETLFPDNDGTITLTGGDFGLEWSKYNDALTKANYAAVFAKESKDDGKRSNLLCEVIMEHTGARKVIFNFTTGYSSEPQENWSNIDHQSGPGEDGEAGKVFENKKTLKDFIFNPCSWLFTGNDNEGHPPNFYDVDPNIQYTHRLTLDGVSSVELFTSPPDRELLQEALTRLANQRNRSYDELTIHRYSYGGDLYNKEIGTGCPIDSFIGLDHRYITDYKLEDVYGGRGAKFMGHKIIQSCNVRFRLTEVKTI